MHRYCLTAFIAVAFFIAPPLTQVASAQVKATAPEKMMPRNKAKRMRECEKQVEQQNIKMEDRSRFVNACLAAGPKK